LQLTKAPACALKSSQQQRERNRIYLFPTNRSICLTISEGTAPKVDARLKSVRKEGLAYATFCITFNSANNCRMRSRLFSCLWYSKGASSLRLRLRRRTVRHWCCPTRMQGLRHPQVLRQAESSRQIEN